MRFEQGPVAVTGAAGFIGSNLVMRLREQGYDVRPIDRQTGSDEARRSITESSAIFHLAGANRPTDPGDFDRDNVEFTKFVADAVREGGNQPLVVYSSSMRAGEPGDYGRTKREAETVLESLQDEGRATVLVDRLPNVFGKWSRPNYNSVVATFCHNVARSLPIHVDDPQAPLSLTYIDDLTERWTELLKQPSSSQSSAVIYETTVGTVAETIQAFAAGREKGVIEPVGEGLARALYATFISFLPVEAVSYTLSPHSDARGTFTEVLATKGSGQISALTAHPGVTRGQHYHHSKVEKMLVVAGRARFRFRHLISGEKFELTTSAESPTVVETIPGWAHDITNIGDDQLVALLWANERFDPSRPDTVAAQP